MALSVSFLIRGLLRGTVAQVFAFSGIVLGVITSSAVADAVGTHWREAKPEFVFTPLRWTVAALSGLGVAAVMQWWGGALAKATHGGPLGWLDRALGALLGLAAGLLCSVALLVLLLQAPGLEFARPLAARGLTTGPLIAAGDLASTWGRSLPGGLWLHEQLRSAARHLAARRQA